jgi:serine protease Do
MLQRKNAGGWVLTLVALALFGGLILRGLSGDEPASPEDQISAGMVMTGKERASARDLSAAFEAITAQYLPVVATIAPSGCGILVSSDGYILTTNTKLPNDDSVRVVLNKGRQFSGWIVGRDPATTLALIKIAAKGLPYAKLGDSDRLRVGQWVMSLGSGGHAETAVTAAIINAKGRSKVSLPQLEDFIHVDTPLDRAQGGGALVSLEGEIVGINTTIKGHDGSLAIPANLARRVMHGLMKEGKVTRGDLGVVAQNLDQNLARALKLNNALGALIIDVAAHSPAERAGLRRGDVILQFANVPIADANELENAVAAQMPGKNVQAVVWRDSVKTSCDVIPDERHDAANEAPAMLVGKKNAKTFRPANKLGLHVQNLSPDKARQHNLHGVTISHLDPLASAGRVLAVGDIIHEINRQPIRGVREFNAALQELQAGEVALLLVRRGEKRFFSGVEVKE